VLSTRDEVVIVDIADWIFIQKMKRSSDEVEGTQQCSSGDDNSDVPIIASSDDLSKKQKVTNDDAKPQPQLHLMPVTPATPPQAPLPSPTPVAPDGKLRLSYKMPKRKVYSSKDSALWQSIAVKVYRAQVNIHNVDYASDYMRYWYKEHQGLRTPPPKPPRSAYSIYFNEQKSLWCQTHSKWDIKKDTKKVGAMWKALSEDEKRQYHDRMEKARNQYNTNTDSWQTKAAEWRLEKAQRLKASGEELDPEKRAALRLNDICVCELCKPKED